MKYVIIIYLYLVYNLWCLILCEYIYLGFMSINIEFDVIMCFVLLYKDWMKCLNFYK